LFLFIYKKGQKSKNNPRKTIILGLPAFSAGVPAKKAVALSAAIRLREHSNLLNILLH
jgi:hypothetical protein